MKRGLRLCTYVFGGHVERLKKTVQSLGWPENRKALEGAFWRIYTDDARVEEIVSPLGLKVEFQPPPIEGGSGERMLKALTMELELCVQHGESLMTVQPDTVFGDGTIGNLIALGHGTKNAIAVPHPRVNLDFPVGAPVRNAQLVKLAFKNMHPLWQAAHMGAKKNNVFKTGAGWMELRKDLYAVQVRIPTPYFVTPIEDDFKFLKEQGAGAWDHLWPAKLMQQQRHRIVGSSDAAFMVELTEERPANVVDRSIEPDAYYGNNLNHTVNRNTICIWRAE